MSYRIVYGDQLLEPQYIHLDIIAGTQLRLLAQHHKAILVIERKNNEEKPIVRVWCAGINKVFYQMFEPVKSSNSWKLDGQLKKVATKIVPMPPPEYNNID